MMAYSHPVRDVLFASSDYSVNDPPLVEPDMYYGEMSDWDWTAEFHDVGGGTQTSTDYFSSFEGTLSPHSDRVDVDSSPFSAGTPLTHSSSEALHDQDLESFDSAQALPPPEVHAGASPHTAFMHPSLAGSFAALPDARSVPSPPSSDPASPNHPPRAPIHRDTVRHRNATTSFMSGASSALRYPCNFGRCTKHFSRSSDLARHLNDVHGRSGKHYECAVETCSYYSRRADKVKEHCQKMHHQPRGHERLTTVIHSA